MKIISEMASFFVVAVSEFDIGMLRQIWDAAAHNGYLSDESMAGGAHIS